MLVGGSFNSSTTLNVTVADNSERESPERFRANLNGVSRAYMIRSTNNGDYPLCDAQESTTTSGPLTGALVKHSDPTTAIGVWSSTECENNPGTPGCDDLFSEELFECDLPSVPRPCWTEISSVDPIRANPTGVDVWIADNDGAHFTMTGPSSVTEGESATFRVTVSNKTPGTDMLVRWKVEETGNSYSATQNGDFAAQNGTLTFNSNDQTETFTVTTIDDDDDEHNEEVYISVIGQSNEAPIPIYGGDEHGIRNSHRPKLRIMDNDDPVMRIRTVQDTFTRTIDESDEQAVFRAELLGNPSSPVSVQFRTLTTGTATAGEDFEPTSGTIVFAPNQNSQWPTATITYDTPTARTVQFAPDSSQHFPTIVVAVIDDSDHEANETIELELHSLTGPATLLSGPTVQTRTSAVATIVSDDPAPVITTTTTARPTTTIPPLEELEEDHGLNSQGTGDGEEDANNSNANSNSDEDANSDSDEDANSNSDEDANSDSEETARQDANSNANSSEDANSNANSSEAGEPASVQRASGEAADLGLEGVDSHRDDILELHDLGVFDGTECDGGGFCWNEPISREVAAVWIIRVLDGGDDEVTASSTRFDDVDPTDQWAGHIERLAVLEVTVGCARDPLRFCPDDPAKRSQTASFLVRAFNLEAADSVGFEDTAGSVHEADIDALRAAGVTTGCSSEPLLFCPDQLTTRAQMASFLNRARSLTDGT